MRSCQYWAVYFPRPLRASREQTHCPPHRLANDLILCIYSFLHSQSVKSFLKGFMSSVLHKYAPFWWLHLQLDLSERDSSFPVLCLSLSQPGCLSERLWDILLAVTLLSGACSGWLLSASRGISADIVQALRSLPASLTEPLFPPSACLGSELTRGILSTWRPTTKQRVSWRSTMQRTSWLSLLRLSVPPPLTVSS